MPYLFLAITAVILYFVLKRVFKIYKKYSSKRYPNFFYDNVNIDDVGIPVFVYHSVAGQTVPDSVTSDQFERQMRYLALNEYQTLTADEFIDHIVFGNPVPKKSVLITFDDGRASVWTTAFPILNKYHLKAVCFLVPAIMKEKGVRQSFQHSSPGPASVEFDLSENPTITWEEAGKMHDTGLIDFQSHTLEHALIFYSPEIVDFIHPGYRSGFNSLGVPVIHPQGENRGHRLGTPIYRYLPRMGAAKRYFDDVDLRTECIAWVASQMSEKFFNDPAWRDKLVGFVKEYRSIHPLHDSYELQNEQELAIRNSLVQSKKIIESYLPGHIVRHLAYPWNHFSVLASSYAKELGYASAFIDINPKKFPPRNNNPYLLDRLIPKNEFGDDPFLISRVDARDGMVLSLPGEGRLTFFRRFLADFFSMPGWLTRFLQ